MTRPVIDMRSDTVTKPTAAMRTAMTRAELGDDGYRDDPTVLELEAIAAAVTGKEAALFMPSGTMSNLVAVLAWSRRGGTVLAEATSHIIISELDGAQILAGQRLCPLPGRNGRPDLAELGAALRDSGDGTRLVCLENSHTASGGRVLDPAYMADVRREIGDATPLHLDGARLFNAAARLGCDVRSLCRVADSVALSLSKGLSAPIGSVLCGPAEMIERAHMFRKMLGGGMRQVGIVAAAGIVALTGMTEQAGRDNARAQRLARRLSEARPGLVDPAAVETNIVLCNGAALGRPAQEIADTLRSHGVLARVMRSGELRFVVHRHIGDAEIDRLVDILGTILEPSGTPTGSTVHA